jgi:hypothetical protein
MLIAGLITAYIGIRYFQRRRLLRRLRVARIGVDEVRRRQIAGEPLSIFDLRSRAELERDPQVISGARRVDYDALIRHAIEWILIAISMFIVPALTKSAAQALHWICKGRASPASALLLAGSMHGARDAIRQPHGLRKGIRHLRGRILRFPRQQPL